MNDDINLRTIHDTIYDIRNVLLIFSDKAFFFFFFFFFTFASVRTNTCGNNRVRGATIYESVQLFVLPLHITFVTLNLLREDHCEYVIFHVLWKILPKFFLSIIDT